MSKRKKNEEKNYRPTIVNRKARHEFTFLDTYEAGISLTGPEVKSIRLGKVQMGEAFCYFEGGELYIKDLHISPYTEGSINNLEPARKRKLLLKRRELTKLQAQLEEKGLTLIASKLYFNARNYIKVRIALAKGKKLYDKRDDIKARDTDRDVKRQLSQI